eukprot:COSAG02_NODE_2597_length_8456_cov_4.666866_7_plen_32_part_01
MSEVTENPMSADAASTAKANIDPKLLEVETEV